MQIEDVYENVARGARRENGRALNKSLGTKLKRHWLYRADHRSLESVAGVSSSV